MRKLLLVFFLFFSRILHAEENPLALSFFGSFFHSENVPNALFFFSDIERNDSFELRRALRTHEIDTIVLLSDGGSVWEALNLAGIIFDNKMTTYIPQIRDDLGCYSACAFMFFAGQTRLVEGELGVHQVGAYDSELDVQQQALGEVQQSTQFTTSEIIGFLNEFGTPPWVYERMFRSRELYIFTDSEKLNLDKGAADQSNKQAIDFFLYQLEEETQNDVGQDETQGAPPIFENSKDLRIAIQSELKRIGCFLGHPYGIIDLQSRLALEALSKDEKLDIETDISLFDNEFFYLYLKELSAPICLEPQDEVLNAFTPKIMLNGDYDAYHESVRRNLKRAEKGDGGGMAAIADYYRYNSAYYGFPIDYEEELYWIYQAAKAGDIRSMMKLASIYEEGRYLARNLQLAMHWLFKAADAGNGIARRRFGLLCESVAEPLLQCGLSMGR